MRVAHILRKYDPSEWGGTETAVSALGEGLRARSIDSTVFCPALARGSPAAHGCPDPLAAAGHRIARFRAFLPILGLPKANRQKLRSVGGNLISLEAPLMLLRAPGLSLIHSHSLNRLGAIGRVVARSRRIPFVVTIHGGALDLSPETREELARPARGGLDWGRLVGAVLRSRQLLQDADAVIALNDREGDLLRARFPKQRVRVSGNGINVGLYQADRRAAALAAFPELNGRPFVVMLGRLDPVKNQGWVLRESQRFLAAHPALHVVLVGADTDADYGDGLRRSAAASASADRIHFLGALPPRDPRLVGLLQLSAALILPSVSETFGLVLLEAWAAGTAVLSSRTAGALSLVKDGENGALFELREPDSFHAALGALLLDEPRRLALAAAGSALVEARFDARAAVGRVIDLYRELCERKSVGHAQGGHQQGEHEHEHEQGGQPQGGRS